MNVLFIHQNFPGQYKHLAPTIASQPGMKVVAFATHERPIDAPRVEVRRYKLHRGSTKGIHPWGVDFETHLIRGEACAKTAWDLKQEGFEPHIICAHPGWGEALFLKDIWPNTRVLGYHEYHYTASHTNFDTEFTAVSDWQGHARLRAKNATFHLGYDDIDWGMSPTYFQWSTLPERIRKQTTIVHDGVDTRSLVPKPDIKLELQSQQITLDRRSEVITFCSRHLEPTRGFHRFMRALPEIQQNHPQAQVFFVGREGNGYGGPHPSGKSYKELMLAELEGQLDLSRLHFVGPLPYNKLIGLLQLSSVHIYFTVPFVLSWSMLEAMSCGALVVGSNTDPVAEVIKSGRNGLLVDYFKPHDLAEAVKEVLNHPDRCEQMRQAARQTIVEHYDLTYCLRKQSALINALAIRAL
jgi:glycosyltransferase involved in cell wall biosynthesis